MEQLRPNAQRAKNAILLIWIMLMLDVVLLLSNLMQYHLLDTAANGGEISIADAEANDMRQQVLAVVYMITFIISIVTFLQWFRRAHFNLSTQVPKLEHSENDTLWSWFIPILSLYAPYNIMKALYKKTDDVLGEKLRLYTHGLSTKYLGWWWALWIISGVIEKIGYFQLKDADTVSELIVVTNLNIITLFWSIFLCLITIKIITDYSKIEPLLFQLKGEMEEEEDDREEM